LTGNYGCTGATPAEWLQGLGLDLVQPLTLKPDDERGFLWGGFFRFDEVIMAANSR